MKHLTIIILVILGGLLLAACGGGGATPDESGNLTIELSEYKFTPDDIELNVGQKVTFTLMNMGEKDHELMIGRDVMMMDGAPNGFEHDFFEGVEPMVMRAEAMDHEEEEMDHSEEEMDHDEEEMDHEEEEMGHMDHSGFMVEILQGSDNATVTFTVTEDMVGEWELGCFEDDGQHYDDGMKGTLVVSR